MYWCFIMSFNTHLPDDVNCHQETNKVVEYVNRKAVVLNFEMEILKIFMIAK